MKVSVILCDTENFGRWKEVLMHLVTVLRFEWVRKGNFFHSSCSDVKTTNWSTPRILQKKIAVGFA